MPVSSGKTVSRYLTHNPKTAAGKALWQLTLTLKDSGKTAFQGALQAWFEQHEGFLNERTVNEETGSSHYTHKTLRSAYLSLKRNLDYLFTFEAILSWAYATPPICWMDALPT